MKLYIAEKPSLGRAIAAALPKPHKNHKTHIELANGDMVSWCIGHILAQANPEDYDLQFKKWQMETLPIIPEQWQLKPIYRTRSQLTVLRKLVKQASEIIHAGDPDREGQLLVDEVIDYLKVPKTKKLKTKRLLISDLNLSAVKRALNALKDNSEFMPLSISALARSRADWLYGINLTRAYTIQGQKSGFNSVLSVGRVQTPVLGLVVKREQDIANFVSKPFYQVFAHLQTEQNEYFTAKWQPSEHCQPHCDEEGRVLNKALAENVINRITNQPAVVNKVSNEQKQQNAPLPFNLSSLQISAAKQFSMNAKLVLDVCQALYEKHKLITYPRSDCRYLPKEQFHQAPTIVKMLCQSSLPAQPLSIQQQAEQANTSLKSKAWNDKKVTAHHAIVPTEKSANNIALNPFEKNIYGLIVRQYLLQFYPAYQYQQTKITVTIANGLFTCQLNEETQLGWKALFPKNKKEQNESTLSMQKLPSLTKGQVLQCTKGELIEKHTSPPASFTDASLLSAMTGIARYVKDANIKKVLRDTDGLGTDATRAGIIELLFKRDFLKRQGKTILATETGKALINALPEHATLPDMTAQWEASLTAISEKTTSYQHFMAPLTQTVTDMVNSASQQDFSGLPKVSFKPKRGKKKFAKKKAS
ncbi:DNA topoisomerase III [Colwellia sp. RSH04]|uniref:DNA topoisomerase III n=1 Tax=Colwellia sp. RSH04 TaxID=2305464 RepID=UPI000E597A1C|nr:DNA topoisomerase III [Colwellia sp. RSH04]RHW76242.1 DNA topoisomerase III [Colwellia sp. RSH04]